VSDDAANLNAGGRGVFAMRADVRARRFSADLEAVGFVVMMSSI
jgi:hypothetical protein